MEKIKEQTGTCSPGIKNVELSSDGNHLVILDQTRLPNEEIWTELKTAEDIYEAIFRLKVRGAPAIGVCAAYGIYILSGQISADSYGEFFREFHRFREYLESSRPTAVNLSWALERMENVVRKNRNLPPEEIRKLLLQESRMIQKEDEEMCRSIGEYGLSLIKDGDDILTHCNAGALAATGYGTALAPLYLGKEKGMKFHVFADETRPLLQGARLTSYELWKSGIDVTLICDNMASAVMKNGWINACFAGCDRVAANGDTANKIGTNGVAVLAKYYGIPFYVLGPTSTIDMECPTGNDIPIELRDPEEIRHGFYREPMAPPEVRCYNPAFDVTDHDLITGIVTEKGIVRPPFDVNLKRLFDRD